MAITVECDFCGETCKNPNFNSSIITGGKDFFTKNAHSTTFICIDCVEFSFEIYQERCEEYYNQKTITQETKND